MAYDYTKASDLVKWCLEQKDKPNIYRLGGIGRYEGNTRIFDCVGMIKCFIWHDYSSNNASYYGVTCPDWNEGSFFNAATEKGTIDTIPEIPGLMVWQEGHIGVYLGNGEVVESTIAFESKIVLSHFKGNHTSHYRGTWTHWFKMPYLSYDAPKPSKKSIDEVSKEVINGDWGNGEERKKRLEAAGYNYAQVQARVDEILLGKQPTPQKKSIFDIAHEVINGKWGNGNERIEKLRNAGYDPNEVQKRVNEIIYGSKKSIDEIARQVINGDWGNGSERFNRLRAAGYDPNAVQKRVNELLGS